MAPDNVHLRQTVEHLEDGASALLPHGAHELYSLNVSTIARSEDLHAVAACEVCGNEIAQPRFHIDGTRFDIVECSGCSLGKLFPKPSAQEIQDFYPAAYYGTEGSKFSRVIEPLVRLAGTRRAWFIARQIKQGGRVLDVGCGRGITLRRLADSGLETHGFELSASAVQGIDPRVLVNIAPSLVEAKFPGEYFDGVVIWHVLEHVPDPRELIAEAWRILKPGGTLIVAVPNFSSIQARWAGEAWFHLDPPRHLFHFPAAALRRMMADGGFQCRSTHHFSLRQNPYGWIQSALNRIPWLPRNGLYAMLHCAGARQAALFGRGLRLQLWAWFCLLAVPALVMSVLAAGLRSGATVHITATKTEQKNSPR